MVFATCSSLPTLADVSVTSAAFDDTITVTGTNFSPTECMNQVHVGEFICPLTSSSSTKLTCKLGLNSGLIPGVSYNVEVAVKGIGYAVKTSTFTIQFLPKITSISPVIGSTAGGTMVTINGDGFVDKVSVVLISSATYSKGKVSSSQITIETAACSNGNNALTVYVNNVKAVCGATCNYQCADSVTPVVNSVTPLQISGTSSVTISGSLFGSDASKLKVQIGGQNCAVTSASDSTVVCSLNGLPLGKQLLTVNLQGMNSFH